MKDKCKNCARPSKACIAYVMTLPTNEALEWCRMWKERLGWSNATTAQKSNVPVGTISRIFSHTKTDNDTTGVKLETIRPIICAITGCTLEELESCEGQTDYADAPVKIAHLKEQIKFHEEQIHTKDKQLEAKDQQLAEYASFTKRKNRVIGWLIVATVIPWLIIIAALVIDRMDPSRGFFWLDVLSWAGDASPSHWFPWTL